MIYAQFKNMRLAPVYMFNPRATTEDQLLIATDMLEHGIHLEVMGSKGTWYVIAKIQYNVINDTADITSIGDRLMVELNKDTVDDIKALYSYALRLLREAHEKCIEPTE